MRIRPLFAGFVLAMSVPAQVTANLYDETVLRSFYFSFASSGWYNQLAQARSNGTYVRGDLTVDGVLYKDVGVRFRGNSSYRGVGTKKSINLSMDAFVPGQELYGHDSLNLSNGFNDPSFCREVLSYALLRKYLPAPKANYVKVYINNAYFGLFINVQQNDGKMIKEWYQDSSGNRYRCDPPTSAGNGRSALQWLGNNLQNYQNAYELKTDLSVALRPWEDVRSLCDVLNNTPNTQLAIELPKQLDVDQALWYLALNVVMVNLDSYVNRGNDYYVYHDMVHDKMMLLPWDMNESFGGYAAGMSINQRLNLSVFYNESRSSRPLLGKLWGVVPGWRARYEHHVKRLIDADFNWAVLGPRVAKLQALIDAAVQSDPNKLYTYQQFKDNVTKQMYVNSSFYRTEIPGLKQLCDGRNAHIRAQPYYQRARPQITELSPPAAPRAHSDSFVTARLSGAVGSGGATLFYRQKGVWLEAAMADDGMHGDGQANDGVWGGKVPAGTGLPAEQIQYYVSAASPAGALAFAPPTAAFQAPSFRLGFPTGSSPLKINEVLAINQNGIRDEQGETEDWLELYNSSAAPLPVGGMYLTDALSKPTAWQIPAGTSIPAGGALLIWCDDEPGDGPLHATFKLSGSGETVWLFAADGTTELHSFSFGAQQADVSQGLLVDGQPGLSVAFAQPSPAAPNCLPCSARQYWPAGGGNQVLGLDLLGAPRIGSPVSIELRQGPASGQALLFFAAAGADLALVPGQRLLLMPPLLDPLPIALDGSGAGSLRLTLPSSPALKGISVYMQAAADLNGALQLSNGTRVYTCN